MLILKDSSMEEMLEFLSKAEAAGANVVTVIGPQVDAMGEATDSVNQTVAFEARQLRMLILKLYDMN